MVEDEVESGVASDNDDSNDNNNSEGTEDIVHIINNRKAER